MAVQSAHERSSTTRMGDLGTHRGGRTRVFSYKMILIYRTATSLWAGGVEGVFEELQEFVPVDGDRVGGYLGGGPVGGFTEIVAL
jgi:hypothetical protein